MWQFLTIGFVGLAFMIWFFFKVVRPMLAKPLEERLQDIVQADEQVRTTQAELSSMSADFRTRLERAEDEAETRLAAAVKEAEGLREQILSESTAQVEAIKRRATDEVERERAKARKELGLHAAELAINAARHAAGQSLTGSDHKRLVSEFITKLGAGA